MAKRELNEQQKKFIEVLFAEAGGNPVTARKLAGYSEGYNTKAIMDVLKEEVIEATQLYIAMNAPRAAMAVVSGIADPTELGLKEKLNAAKDLLDRAGLVKTDKVQIEAPSGIMILPAKDKSE
jgi:anthranilate phosphoribosyltransferase